MPCSLLLGMQWGDEGKGKIIDQLASEHDYVVRFQGGGNAGHTVMVGDKHYVFHNIPSGILHPGTVCVIGNGVVLDLAQFFEEIDDLRTKGVGIDSANLWVSDRAHLIFSYHKQIDALREQSRGKDLIGTTKRGIGPSYGDKVSRVGIRVCDLYHKDTLAKRLKFNVEFLNKTLMQPFGQAPLTFDALFEETLAYAKRLQPFVRDTVYEINVVAKGGAKVLFEGAQGALLDIDFGTFPYVTSSNTTGGGMFTGSGLSLGRLNEVIGIAKAYTTRVGTGPFPTELSDATGNFLREEGGEYGATTGRPRRCGWLDIVVLRYSAMLSGVHWMGLTKMDVLNKLDTIKICTGYRINGETTDRFPAFLTDEVKLEPVYQEVRGWNCSLSGCKRYEDLPAEAKNYVEIVEALSGIPVRIISLGPRRGEWIQR